MAQHLARLEKEHVCANQQGGQHGGVDALAQLTFFLAGAQDLYQAREALAEYLLGEFLSRVAARFPASRTGSAGRFKQILGRNQDTPDRIRVRRRQVGDGFYQRHNRSRQVRKTENKLALANRSVNIEGVLERRENLDRGKIKHNGGVKTRRYAGPGLTTFPQLLQVLLQVSQQRLFWPALFWRRFF